MPTKKQPRGGSATGNESRGYEPVTEAELSPAARKRLAQLRAENPALAPARPPRRPTNGNKTLPGNAVSTDERMTDDQEAMILRKAPLKKRPGGT